MKIVINTTFLELKTPHNFFVISYFWHFARKDDNMSKYTLKELISKAQGEMSNHGYSEKTIYCAYWYIWVKLYKYNDPNQELKEVNISKFLNDYFDKDLSGVEKEHLNNTERMYLRAFDVLVKINNEIEIENIKKEKYEFSAFLEKIYEKYIFISINNGNCESTINNKKKIIKLFVERADFNNPSKENLTTYLENLSNKKTITNTIDNRIIRKFLELCYEEKYITIDLLKVWPDSFPNRSLSHVPSSYTDEEINSLLVHASNFKNEDCHLRNYSILCFITYTGLRAFDICNLKFDDIDWNLNKITIIQSKTKKEISFPLISQIGNPLINYITKERPSTSEKFIFVTEKGTKLSSASITSIINRYFRCSKINIKNKHYGAHSLRHSLATTLINNNVPTYNISKILGHSDTRTLSIYSKIDITNLKKCVIEVPYE